MDISADQPSASGRARFALSGLIGAATQLLDAYLTVPIARLRNVSAGKRQAMVIVAHLALIPTATYLAFWLRFDGDIPDEFLATFSNAALAARDSGPDVPPVRTVRRSLALHRRLGPLADRPGGLHEQLSCCTCSCTVSSARACIRARSSSSTRSCCLFSRRARASVAAWCRP